MLGFCIISITMKQYIHLTKSGFTLVELMITILVGGVFAISTTTVVSENSHLVQRSRDQVAVNSFAEGKIEELRSVGYSGLNIGTVDITTELPSDLQKPRSASVQITSPLTGIKKVYLSITYNNQGTQQTYPYTTYIGELGVGQY